MSVRPLGTGKLPNALLREVLNLGSPPPPELKLPPQVGEDAAVLDIEAGALIVASDPVTLTGSGVGAHAVVVNANDIAVMGAQPRWFSAVVLMPAGTTEQDVRELFKDMHAALARLNATLVGGHAEVTDSVKQPVVVGNMLGLREDGGYVRTGGVKAGDVILQVGPAPIEGAAVLATEARDRLVHLPKPVVAAATEALSSPGIAVVEQALRATELGATALHDPTEGGLSAGLYELAEASNLALRLQPDAALWFPPGKAICDALGLDPWGVLASGTLLAAFPEEASAAAQAAFESAGYPTAAIARAEAGDGVHAQDGTALPRYVRDEILRVLGGE